MELLTLTRRSRVFLAQSAAIVAVLAQSVAGPAYADDLRNALADAYKSNPTLEAARANQRAVDEGVPIARSAGLPSLSGVASYTEFVKKSANSFTAPDRAFDAQANASVPLYSGGSVRNSLRAAQTRVNAGKDDLRSTESSVFTQTVAAYLDVIANEAVVGCAASESAADRTELPGREALGSMTQVLFDTLVICSITGVTIVMSGQWKDTSIEAGALSAAAFGTFLGDVGPIVVSIGLLFFATSTIFGWGYYGEKCFQYLFPNVLAVRFYRLAFVLFIFVGATASLDVIWALADVLNGLMAIPTLIRLQIGRAQV